MTSFRSFFLMLLILASGTAQAFVGLGNYKSRAEGDPPPYFTLFVSSKSACGERMLMEVQAGGTRIDDQRQRLEGLIKQAVPRLVQHCPEVAIVHGVIAGGKPSPAAKARGEVASHEYFLLRRENQWRIESIAEPGTDDSIPFTENKYFSQGHLTIDEAGIRGRYGPWKQYRLDATVVGTEGEGAGQTLLIGGHWYEFGTGNLQCEQSRNGFPYWGSLEVRIPRSSNMGVLHPMRKPCAEAAEPGTASRWPWLRQNLFATPRLDAELIALIDAHQLRPEEGPASLREGEPLYARDGLNVFPGKQGWCSPSRAHLDFVHDMPAAQLLEDLDRDYARFLDDTLEPIIQANCPDTQGIVVREFVKDEPEPRSTLTYGSYMLLKTRVFDLEDMRLSDTTNEHLYQLNCAGCHDYGAGGAPATGLSHWPTQGPDLKALLYTAMDNNDAHVGRLQCPDCSDDLARELVRYMGTRQPPAQVAETLSPRQRTQKWYGERMTPEALLTSGLLPRGEMINHLYRGHFAPVSDVSAARDLFVYLIQSYSRQCGSTFPGQTATYTQRERVVSDVEHTMTEDHYTLEDIVVNRVTMDARYYDYYARIAPQYRHLVKRMDQMRGWRDFHERSGSGLIPAMKQMQFENALNRTATSRALLASPGACTAPATHQFMDNLWQFLSNPETRHKRGDDTPSHLASERGHSPTASR